MLSNICRFFSVLSSESDSGYAFRIRKTPYQNVKLAAVSFFQINTISPIPDDRGDLLKGEGRCLYTRFTAAYVAGHSLHQTAHTLPFNYKLMVDPDDKFVFELFHGFTSCRSFPAADF